MIFHRFLNQAGPAGAGIRAEPAREKGGAAAAAAGAAAAARLGSARLGSALLGAVRPDSALVGLALIASAGLGSGRPREQTAQICDLAAGVSQLMARPHIY